MTIIHCDHCGAEITEQKALLYEGGKGELFYFCDRECLTRCQHLSPVQMPDREERGVGSAVPVVDDDGPF